MESRPWFSYEYDINGPLSGGKRSFDVTLQELRDKYDVYDKGGSTVKTITIVFAVLLFLIIGIIAVVGTGGIALAALPAILVNVKSILTVIVGGCKVALVIIAFCMLFVLPYITPFVMSEHDAGLDDVEQFIINNPSTTATVHSITTAPQTEFSKDTKSSITVAKKASNIPESVMEIIISPDGRIIDTNRYQTSSKTTDYETLSSSIRLPHQPGNYKILAMTFNDMMKSSIKQVEVTQVSPEISVDISTNKVLYDYSEIVTVYANFTNGIPEKAENLMYSIDILNTTCNKTGFLEIDANSSKIETLSFVPETNGTYKATVTLFAGLYIVDTTETGFTVESGSGVSVNIDSKEVYNPNTNVTANLTIKNIGTEIYSGNAEISTVDTLNDYLEVYNAIESLSVNESEEKEMQYMVLPKESSTPGIYMTYIYVDNSTYFVHFTVAANGTIFITAQTDKLIYSDLESVIVNISVNDVAFNATNATLNMTLSDPNGNKTYFNVTGSNGNYSTIISPDNKSVNGTYNILVNGTKDGYRVYSDHTFFIVNGRTKLRCDIPRVIQLNTTDTINLFVETDTNQSIKDVFVTLTGCGFNGTKTTDENGLVIFGTGSMNKTGVIDVNIEKGGYGSFIGNMDIVSENHPPIANCTYTPENPDVNQTITFNATSSYDPDGNITDYEWNFGDGNITNTTEPIINHSYASIGDYTVNLTVTDNDGATNTTSKIIAVTRLCGNVAPCPDCDGTVDMGDVILLLNNVSYPENPRYVLCNAWAGDCRCTGVRDMGDVILLLNNVSYPEVSKYALDCCG